MWVYRRMLIIFLWIRHVSNEEVLRKMRPKTPVVHRIRKIHLKFPGEIIRINKASGICLPGEPIGDKRVL